MRTTHILKAVNCQCLLPSYNHATTIWQFDYSAIEVILTMPKRHVMLALLKIASHQSLIKVKQFTISKWWQIVKSVAGSWLALLAAAAAVNIKIDWYFHTVGIQAAFWFSYQLFFMAWLDSFFILKNNEKFTAQKTKWDEKPCWPTFCMTTHGTQCCCAKKYINSFSYQCWLHAAQSV